ncbi:DODA-type extradiol aromatic ring-opening family dioxygenase [Kibdelosporangium aridum]|uniref:2-aminophenol/2-amino-5-chlorophenol 1,6-dioxygenase alpha subunit n=1 Tax=Kibdelosporangium aridum TaxID=2030 RepID=A0A1Y5Y752_KIBAR|nr:2-amino-5-chlorophenol 1,6-dioxygenase subunit alpha [Kibdelosporangium aridum]SMD26597.1 2-aminophenol/2-amino-5-chlorophenol 1,6-dioxygenase alpha subunit [Kibdelosporangium aridum]
MSEVVSAALLPGMPQLLAKDPAASWADLRSGVEQVGDRFHASNVDTVVLLSTQWFTVLGHQFQLDPNPRGQRLDENWYAYDYGHIDYDLRIDTELTERWVEQTASRGMQARRTHYAGFPIDTGTVTVSALLDPGRRFKFALVSCNLYAEVDSIASLGATGVAAAASVGRRIGVVVVSGLSAGLIQQWIEPSQDRIATPEQDTWNRRMLAAVVDGDADEALRLREGFAREAAADSQFRALAFLLGAGVLGKPAELLAYGPIWGTGAAVVHWPAASFERDN